MNKYIFIFSLFVSFGGFAKQDQPVVYEIYGKGDTCLFFIHGWNLDQTYWDNQVREFSPNYRVVTVDLAGHGLSTSNRSEWTVENFAADLVSVLEKENLRNIILIGHSMGGEIALETYLKSPERVIALIGVDNFKDVDFTIDEKTMQDYQGLLSALKNDYDGTIDQFLSQALFGPYQDTEAYERVKRDYHDVNPETAMVIFEGLFPYYEQVKFKITELKFPLRIIMSDYSPYNEEGLKRYAPNGYSIRVVKQSGHFPMVEQPEQFNRALHEMINEM